MKGYATWKVRKVFLCVYDSTTSSEKEDLLFFFFLRPKHRKENIYTRILIASLRRSYFSNLFQAFEISQSVRARPRENSSEYSSRIRILIKDREREDNKEQPPLGFFCGGIFRGSCDDDHHPSISNVPARNVAHALLFIRIVT